MIAWVAADGAYGGTPSSGGHDLDLAACERDALVAGRRLRYLDAGAGERALLLVHGMGGCRLHWSHTVRALAGHARVLALDLPGFGASELPAAGASLDGFADIAADLARALGIERLVFVGHSLGGPIAIRFAARHPDLAEAIVLVGGAVFQFSALLGLRDVPRLCAERPRESAAIAAEVIGAGLPVPAAACRLIARSALLRRAFLAPYAFQPAGLAPDGAALLLAGAGARGVWPTVRAIGRSEPLEGIERVACPILSIAGQHDRIAPLRDTEAFQRHVPRARTIVLAGCGHMAMLERPQAFNAQLLAFARELSATPPTPPR
ncbi:MAG: alpha/beta fold hydrolase [Solirubrobacteraceae bacterium]